MSGVPGRQIALIISAALFACGLIAWLVFGGGVGFIALAGVLGLAVTFIFSGGPRKMYGPVSEQVRQGEDPGPAA
jgi:xanthine/uracil permease